MSRPEYATTKSGLIAQVSQLHAALEAMTESRDSWEQLCQQALEQIQGWRTVAEAWQTRYYETKAGSN